MAGMARGAETPTKKKAVKSVVAGSTPAPQRKPRTATARPRPVAPEQRRNYIEVAAYYIAERRGFCGGHEAEDWARAELEIDRLLALGKLNG